MTMVKLRRILAVGTTLHTAVLIIDAVIFCLRFALGLWDADISTVMAFRQFSAILGWTGILFGFCLISGAIYATARDEERVGHFIVPALIKILVIFALSFVSGLLAALMQGGTFIF